MVTNMLKSIVLAGVLVLIAGCAGPRSLGGPTPDDVVTGRVDVQAVRWGGQIVSVRNLSDRTLVEVLALPLDTDGRPQSDAPPQGRFLVERAGFLEPHVYASGRLLEVSGRLDGFADGRVGDAPYRYPVVMADTLRLWDRPLPTWRDGPSIVPRIGIGIGSGSSGTRVDGGIGIGIGF
jgi:outer membrane lipoprotein